MDPYDKNHNKIKYNILTLDITYLIFKSNSQVKVLKIVS